MSNISADIKLRLRVQNAAASFVLGHYATLEDTIKLGWLPFSRREWHILKTYVSLEVNKQARNLRSSHSSNLKNKKL